MDITELKNKSIKDLHDLLAQKRDRFRELRFQVSEAQLKNVREVRKVKKEIAQVLTLLNKR